MEKIFEILVIFILPIFGNYDFESFEYSKKKKKYERNMKEKNIDEIEFCRF